MNGSDPSPAGPDPTPSAGTEPIEHPAHPGRRITRLVGVYNAEGTWRGELAYWVGARLGRAHCALCDITHGNVRERADWKACKAAMPVAFDTYHRDDQPSAIRDVVGHEAPVVVADTDRGLVALLGPDEIDDCRGSPQRLSDAISRAAERHQLQWQ